MSAQSQRVQVHASAPFVSIVMPVRNEAKHLYSAVESLVLGTYPSDSFEILIVDGESCDGTEIAIQKLLHDFPSIVRLVHNSRKTTPAARNLGISNARGELIAFADAHATYPSNYIESLVEILLRDNDVSAAGGLIRTVPGDTTYWARCIALAMSMPFGVGDSHARVGVSQERDVDTIFAGVYRRQLFQRYGTFREILIRGQDDEFNHRLTYSGEKLRVTPAVSVDYFARTTLKNLARMMFQYGLYKPLAGKFVGKPTTARQFIPPLFVIALTICIGGLLSRQHDMFATLLAGLLGLHLTLGLSMTLHRVWNSRQFGLVPGAYICAFVMHITYGLGYCWGLSRMSLNIIPSEDQPLTR